VYFCSKFENKLLTNFYRIWHIATVLNAEQCTLVWYGILEFNVPV